LVNIKERSDAHLSDVSQVPSSRKEIIKNKAREKSLWFLRVIGQAKSDKYNSMIDRRWSCEKHGRYASQKRKLF